MNVLGFAHLRTCDADVETDEVGQHSEPKQVKASGKCSRHAIISPNVHFLQ